MKQLKVSSAYGGMGLTFKIGREQVVLDYEEVIKLKEVIDAEFDAAFRNSRSYYDDARKKSCENI